MTFNKTLNCLIAIVELVFSPYFVAYGYQQKPNAINVVDGSALLNEISILPNHIKEASGLEITQGKNLWTHNDGGVPILYCLDTAGHVIRTIQLNHPNSGWEDLTLDNKGTLYVGAFGNNKNDKRSFKIYKIPKPDSIADRVYTAETIQYKYKDQTEFPPPPSKRNFDVDAMVAQGDSLFLFSKNRTTPFTGYTKIYALPQVPGHYETIAVDSIYLGKGSKIETWVTAADISPDGNTLALLSHQCIWLIQNFEGNKFSSGNITKINLGHFSHKAGLCFETNTRLYIVDELELEVVGGKLYSIDIKKIFTNPQ
jgi:hypothetical protein